MGRQMGLLKRFVGAMYSIAVHSLLCIQHYFTNFSAILTRKNYRNNSIQQEFVKIEC